MPEGTTDTHNLPIQDARGQRLTHSGNPLYWLPGAHKRGNHQMLAKWCKPGVLTNLIVSCNRLSTCASRNNSVWISFFKSLKNIDFRFLLFSDILNQPGHLPRGPTKPILPKYLMQNHKGNMQKQLEKHTSVQLPKSCRLIWSVGTSIISSLQLYWWSLVEDIDDPEAAAKKRSLVCSHSPYGDLHDLRFHSNARVGNLTAETRIIIL